MSEQRLSWSGSKARLYWLAAAVFAGVGGVLYLYSQNHAGDKPMPECLFFTATGLYCPGCGSGRAVHALVHGRLTVAARFNPLLALAVPLLLFCAARWTRDTLRRREHQTSLASLRPSLIYAIALAVSLFWVARNIPCWPFTLLAPP